MAEAQVQRRNAAARARGKRWETELRQGLREYGMDVESLRLAGANDEGDMVIRFPDSNVVIEAKNTASVSLSGFVGEALAEASNYSTKRNIPRSLTTGIAIIKRRGHNWKDAYVLTTVREFFGLE
jgi:hypothetical protein